MVKGESINHIMKPLTVARHEFIESLINLINECQLPSFVIETILKDVYTDVRVVAQKQLEKDMKKFHASQENAK